SAQQERGAESGRVLATILCATSRGAEPDAGAASRLQALVAAQTKRFKGRELRPSGGGTFAVFEGPARAIRCARSIVDQAAGQGLAIGVGLHTGEWVRLQSVGEGPLAEAAARIAAQARPGELLVSRIVADLVGTSSFAFTARGADETGAGEETKPLFSVG